MSRTIGSPARMTRSDGLVVGRRAVRAGARRSRTRPASWPSATSRSRISRRRRPRSARSSGPAAICAIDPVGGLGGQPQQLDLVGVLDHPQLAQDRAARSRAAPTGCRSRAGGRASPTAGRSRRAGRSTRPADPDGRRPRGGPTRAIGSSVSSQVDDLDDAGRRPPGSAGPAPPRAAGRRGTTVRRRDDEHRQPLERHRPVAGRGSRGPHRRRRAARRDRRGRERAGCADPLGEARRGDRAAGFARRRHPVDPVIARRSSAPASAARARRRGRAERPATARGPSSNSFR